MLESTGVPEIGARAALRSARAGHDLAMMNVETDITVGPILELVRQAAGRALRPGGRRRARGLQGALRPRRVDGLHDRGRREGQEQPAGPPRHAGGPGRAAEAARRGLSPNMLIEFVDGSKTMIEMAAVSNATGLRSGCPRDARPDHRPRSPQRDVRARRGRRAAHQDRGRGLRHRAGGAGRVPHRAHRPPAPARGDGAARHGRRAQLHALPALPPVQHRGATDLRDARHPAALQHGAAGPAGLRGVRGRQAGPRGRRDARRDRRDDLLQPHRHVRDGPARRACSPSGSPRAHGSSAPWRSIPRSRVQTSRSSRPPCPACGSCRSSGSRERSASPGC